MSRNFWAENMCASRSGAFPHAIVDLGYVKHPVVRRRRDRLIALGIGKGNIMVEYIGRVLVRIPPKKLKKILAACRGMQEDDTYSWTTHSWVPKGGDDLKYSLR